MRVLSFALFFAAMAFASPALAQKFRVVVLEIDGDQNNKLRNQIEAALVKADAVEIIPLDEFRAAAAKKKLNGAAAMTVIGIRRVGKQLGIDAAVSGEVADKYKVLIYDRVGEELWKRDLAVKRGLLSDDFSQKLARAVAAAAEQGAAKNPDTDEGDSGSGSGDGSTGGDTGSGPELDLTGGGDSSAGNSGSGESGTGSGSGSSRGGGRTVVVGNANGSGDENENRDTDLDLEGFKKRKHVGPRTITVTIAGSTTWRTQCLRPGSIKLASCADFDRLADQPVGTTISFTPQVPYLGFQLNAELFPLASFDNRIVNGFGLLGSVNYGSSVTKISETNQQGMTEEKEVQSADVGWSVQAAWRFHFQMGAGDPQGVGYAGLRGGLTSRNFNIDPNAGVPLPSSQRVFPTSVADAAAMQPANTVPFFPVIGADVAFPIIRQFRLELGASIFMNPRPADEQIVGFGNLLDDTGGAQSTGWGLDVGGSGELLPVGPLMLGWTLKLRYQSFFDRYFGQGQKWTVCNEQQCGGLGEETYLGINWGLTLAY